MTEMMIEKLGAKGDGIGIVNGAEIFAPYTAPGERVEGEIIGDRMEKPRVLDPVPLRVKAPCSHFKTCGGCTTQHITPEFLSDWKRDLVIEALAKHGISTEFRPTLSSPPLSRRRAVFKGKRTKKDALLGFHVRGSTQVVAINHCTLVHPDIMAAVAGLKELVKLAATRKSEVRVSVTTSLGGPDISISQAIPLENETQLQVVKITHDHGFSRVCWNGEVVLERQPAQQKFGSAYVTPPEGSFLQATHEGEAALVQAVREIVGPAKRVLDLFSGCGTFTLPLAETAEVCAIESERDMLAALDRGWRTTDGLKKVETKTRDLFRNPLLEEEFKSYDAVVLDPPRAGARAQVEFLAQSDIKTIAFVSCNPATFARDARVLMDWDYSLDWVQTIDQFLWSSHCELVAKFSRK